MDYLSYTGAGSDSSAEQAAADALLRESQNQSQLNRAVEGLAGCVLSPAAAHTAAEYGTEVLKSGSLFFKGRYGLAACAVVNGLDQMHVSDGAGTQALDAGLGATKGAVLHKTFHGVGDAFPVLRQQAAVYGAALGTTNRAADFVFSRSTYVDPTSGTFDVARVGDRFHATVGSVDALRMDVLSGIGMGVTHNIINAQLGNRLMRSPFTSSLITSSSFGFTSGATQEVLSQLKSGRTFDNVQFSSVMAQGLKRSAIDTIAGIPSAFQARRLYAGLHEAKQTETITDRAQISEVIKAPDGAKARNFDSLVSMLESKFARTPDLTPGQVEGIVNRYDAADRPLALAILRHCGPNMTEVGFAAQLHAIHREHGAKLFPAKDQLSVDHLERAATLSPGSSGQWVGYFYRKFSDGRLQAYNLTPLAERIGIPDLSSPYSSVRSKSEYVIFDDLAATRPGSPEAKIMAAAERVYAVDLRGFDKGINLIDCALGPAAVTRKLDALVAEAKTVRSGSDNVSAADVARIVLEGPANAFAQAVPQVQLIRPDRSNISALQRANSRADDLSAVNAYLQLPRVSTGDVAAYLLKFHSSQQQSVASTLAGNVDYFSASDMVRGAKQLSDQIRWTLSTRAPDAQAKFIVDRPNGYDGAGSSNAMSYLMSQVGRWEPSSFVTKKQYDALVAGGQQSRIVPILVDDALYTGAQMTTAAISNYHSNPLLVTAALAHSSGAEQRLRQAPAHNDGRQVLVSLQQFDYGTNVPAGTTRKLADSILLQWGEQTSPWSATDKRVWWYMFPDTSYSGIQTFARDVMKVGGS